MLALALRRSPRALYQPTSLLRYFSTPPPPANSDPYEKEIYSKLAGKLDPEYLMVKDVSGGCGSMFAITVVSQQFEGLTTIKQHRLVNEILKDDIAKWHGIQLQTKKKL